MVYMGSKNRIAKDIIKIMEPYFNQNRMYYEPFVGGANMIDKIPKDKIKGLVGNDANKYLIALLKKLQSDDEILFNFIEKSEYNLEDENFKEVWRKSMTFGFGNKKQIEKLYMYKKENI